jgi:hypothetical protein
MALLFLFIPMGLLCVLGAMGAMTPVNAAPLTPISGKIHQPKMRNGQRAM